MTLKHDIAALAAREREALEQKLLAGRRRKQEKTRFPIVSRDERPVLSFAQQRLWLIMQLEPASPAYNVYRVIRIRGPLDVDALAASIELVTARHETLRTTFPASDGKPWQRVRPAPTRPLRIIEVARDDPATLDGRAQALIDSEVRAPFDLEAGPVFRPRLLKLGPDHHVLVLTLHHITCDEWSLRVLLSEIETSYLCHARAKSPVLPSLPIQYADYAAWQTARLEDGALSKELAYWRERLESLPIANSLTPTPLVTTTGDIRGGKVRRIVSRDVTNELDAIAKGLGATPFMITLAAFKLLIHAFCGETDIVVGTAVAGRTRGELESLVGFFANLLVLRTDASGDPTFSELVARTRETVVGALTHQEVPFDKIVQELNPERKAGVPPLASIIFTHRAAIHIGLDQASLETTEVAIERDAPKFDLWLSIVDDDDCRRVTFEYRANQFDAGTVEALADSYDSLLGRVAYGPERRLSELPLLSDAAQMDIVARWNDPSAPYPREATIPGLFEAQAKERPDAIAVSGPDRDLSYGELDQWANRIAHRLKATGLGPEEFVGVATGRTPALIAGLLGILKAGGAYLPLDPALPSKRLRLLLAEAETRLVLDPSGRLDLPEQCVRVESSEMRREGDGAGALTRQCTARSLAYLSFTSGSTGRPKGVAVEHRAVIRLATGSYARFGPEEVFLQLAPVSFDASTFEIWGCLLSGGRLVQVSDDEPTLAEIASTIEHADVTTLWLTAGLFHRMVDRELGCFRRVGQLLAGGDVLSPSHVARFIEAFPDCTLINGYGPTENTTFTTTYTIADPSRLSPSVPIGRPVDNTRVYILDKRQRPVPVGAIGELYAAGDGLARGYLHRPELTAERFVADPFSPSPDARMYRTGDRARYLHDGLIQFVGRVDDQLKIQGFRIEPGEIEHAIGSHPDVAQAAVRERDNAAGEGQLVGYVVPAPGRSAPSSAAVRDFLKQSLPRQMVPAAIVPVDEMPLTAVGKIDKDALPPLDWEKVSKTSARVEPRNAAEVQLARIWRELLGHRQFGVEDNFFEVGGHSLAAAEMISRIELIFGRALPLHTLWYGAGTIAALSTALSKEHPERLWSRPIALRTGGRRPPVFLVHIVGGILSDYRELSRTLEDGLPVYGLQAVGIDGSVARHTDVNDIAAHCVESMRKIQQTGPYRLIGFCSAGIFALEVARQLEAMGEVTELVALIDSPAPLAFRPRWPSRILRRLKTARLGSLPRWLRRQNTSREADDTANTAPIGHAHKVALSHYRPRPFAGQLVLFLSQTLRGTKNPTAEWSRLAAGGVAVEHVPAKHDEIMRRPTVQQIARSIEARLSATDAGIASDG